MSNRPMTRYLPAFGTSATVHVSMVAMLAWIALHPAIQSAAPSALPVFVLPAPEDATYLGLNPIDTASRDWNLRTGGVSGALSGAELNKIAEHAAVLFPFVTPGLSLDAFFPLEALAPYHAKLRNPLGAFYAD